MGEPGGEGVEGGFGRSGRIPCLRRISLLVVWSRSGSKNR